MEESILVVDDEERMRKLIKDFLTNKGYHILEAEDGEKARIGDLLRNDAGEKNDPLWGSSPAL